MPPILLFKPLVKLPLSYLYARSTLPAVLRKVEACKCHLRIKEIMKKSLLANKCHKQRIIQINQISDSENQLQCRRCSMHTHW